MAKKILICGKCHKKGRDVKKRVDPYQKEINDKILRRNFCNECYEDALNDI